MNANEAAKVIFLDRDGTLNVDHGYVYQIQKWEWIQGAIEGMKLLQDAGYKLAIITNQSGIAQGFYTEEDMQVLHTWMEKQLADHGVTLSAIAYCPHGRDSTCDCRKPNAGMAKQVEATIGSIDYGNSWTIGDKEADVGFGKNAGTKTMVIKSRYWEADNLQYQPDMIVDSLLEAAHTILK